MKAMTIKGIDEEIYKGFKTACAEQGIEMKASVISHMENIKTGNTLNLMYNEILRGLKGRFSGGELKMLIDIFNATALTPGILGQHIIVQVEDSFALYPGMYEKKWDVAKKAMLKKIKALSPVDAAMLEIWAVACWQDDHYQDIEVYVKK